MPRVIAREMLDDERSSDDEAEWRGSLDDLERVNCLLGGRRLIRKEMERLSRLPSTVIDVATGGADMPAYVLDLLRSRGVEATCTAVDISPRVLAIARTKLGDRSDITLVKADAQALPFPDGAFDLGMLTLALHHFDGERAVRVLRELARVARTAIVNDLRRSVVAWLFASLVFPMFTHNRFTRHDGPVSVRRAYTPDEAHDLAAQAGWSRISVRKHPGYRMALVGGRS